MFESGLIGISNNKTGFFASLIRFFTQSKYSHCFITLGDFYKKPLVLEASVAVVVVSYGSHYLNDSSEDYLLYRINVPKEKLEDALAECIDEYGGVSYGYLQCLWFVYRWFMSLFGKDVRGSSNWFTDGIICSELLYDYLYKLGFGDLLKDYSPDTIQTQDILDIMNSAPTIFTRIQ